MTPQEFYKDYLKNSVDGTMQGLRDMAGHLAAEGYRGHVRLRSIGDPRKHLFSFYHPKWGTPFEEAEIEAQVISISNAASAVLGIPSWTKPYVMYTEIWGPDNLPRTIVADQWIHSGYWVANHEWKLPLLGTAPNRFNVRCPIGNWCAPASLLPPEVYELRNL